MAGTVIAREWGGGRFLGRENLYPMLHCHFQNDMFYIKMSGHVSHFIDSLTKGSGLSIILDFSPFLANQKNSQTLMLRASAILSSHAKSIAVVRKAD